MGRWIAAIFAIALAACAGYLAGYLRWGMEAAQTQRVEERLRKTDSELTGLQEQKQDLQQRLEQVSKEQERLAQENEILRKQQTIERLTTGQGGELPALPPK